MTKLSGIRAGLAGGVLLTAAAFPVSGANADPICDTIIASMVKQAGKPFSSTLTMKSPFGQRVMKSVNTGTKLYLNIQGGWQVVTFDAKQQAAAIRKNAAAVKQTCRKLPDDKVNGEPANVFTAHVDNKGALSENKIWISKASGLPLKTEISFKGQTMSTLHDYKHVQPPPGAK